MPHDWTTLDWFVTGIMAVFLTLVIGGMILSIIWPLWVRWQDRPRRKE